MAKGVDFEVAPGYHTVAVQIGEDSHLQMGEVDSSVTFSNFGTHGSRHDSTPADTEHSERLSPARYSPSRTVATNG